VHLSVRNDAAARREAALAAATLRGWAAGSGPAVLGGDFNIRRLALPGFELAAVSDVDCLYGAAGWSAGGSASVLERGTLSDHAPLAVTFSTR